MQPCRYDKFLASRRSLLINRRQLRWSALQSRNARLCSAVHAKLRWKGQRGCLTRLQPITSTRHLHATSRLLGGLYHPEDPTFDPRTGWERCKNLFKEETSSFWNGVIRGDQTVNQWKNRWTPNFCDVLIVGGGIMGSAVAFCLKQTLEKPLTIVVLDKDMSFKDSQTVNSTGTIRTQFSVAEHVRMSLYTAQFLREFRQRLNLRGIMPPDINFTPQGYLFLGTADDHAKMEKTHDLQIGSGAHVALMQPDQLHNKFPWLNIEGISLASYGIENEGWYDPWTLLVAMRDKNLSRGCYYVEGELLDLVEQSGSYTYGNFVGETGVYIPDTKHKGWIKLTNGTIHPMTYCFIVNAAGAKAKEIAEMGGIGVGRGLMSIPLPIERRKRTVFAFQCPEGPNIDMPIIVDPIGYHVRREGFTGTYIASPLMTSNDQEPDPSRATSLEQKELYFNNVLWPKLAYRIPAFRRVKYCGAWDNFVDWNYFDNSAIIGPHPYMWNHYFALPGSGNALSMALGIGRGTEEMIYESVYMNVDLHKFHFNRFLNYEPVKEQLVL